MKFTVNLPFVELLGFDLVRFEGGHAEIVVEQRQELTNAWGVIHGGVTMTLLDVVMAQAARSPPQPGDLEGPGVVTVEMKTTFMRPGQGRLTAQGTLMHRTASLAFCEGRVLGADGQIVGHATGTFKYMRGLPAGSDGRRVMKLNGSD